MSIEYDPPGPNDEFDPAEYAASCRRRAAETINDDARSLLTAMADDHEAIAAKKQTALLPEDARFGTVGSRPNHR